MAGSDSGFGKSVRLSIEGRVATITICREQQLNALNIEVLHALSEANLKVREKISDLGVLILRGAGEKAFVAGADIKVMQQATQTEIAEFIWLGQRVMREFEALELPVLAVLQGFAIGGGLELALAADLLIASSAARMGQAEINLGLIPGFGGSQRLAARIGEGGAKRLVLTGETITAEEAYRLGVVDYLVEPEKLEEKVKAITDGLLSKSSIALAAGKAVVARHFADAKLAGLTTEAEAFLEIFASAEAKEGISAFVEKRPPNFLMKQS